MPKKDDANPNWKCVKVRRRHYLKFLNKLCDFCGSPHVLPKEWPELYKNGAVTRFVIKKKKVIGAISYFYNTQLKGIDIKLLLAHPGFDKEAILITLLDRMYQQLTRNERLRKYTRYRIYISEYDDEMQVFLRECGFRAVDVIKRMDEDYYVFVRPTRPPFLIDGVFNKDQRP
ncbi:MAG: hypothetical protein KatS3mg105_2191 [Gemmatales bacterium]|nr:MAG: hypothetical protein KatS3mg105_2191 [Gemmatales bacterium]